MAAATYHAYARVLLAKPYPPVPAVRAALQFLAQNYPAYASAIKGVAPGSFIDTRFVSQALRGFASLG